VAGDYHHIGVTFGRCINEAFFPRIHLIPHSKLYLRNVSLDSAVRKHAFTQQTVYTTCQTTCGVVQLRILHVDAKQSSGGRSSYFSYRRYDCMHCDQRLKISSARH